MAEQIVIQKIQTKDFGQEGVQRNFGKRGRYKAICDECGKECFVQHSYNRGRPILCKGCLMIKNNIIPQHNL